MEPVQVSSVLDSVAVLLNDAPKTLFTDTVTLPYFQIAFNDLKLLTASFGLPINNITSPSSIVIPAGILDLGGPTGPPLPDDLLEILSISERSAGTSNEFAMMSRLQFLPLGQTQTAYLGIWSWQNQYVNFIGATGNIEVRLQYLASNLGTVVDETSTIRMYNCRNYLTYRTAGLCAEFIGENPERASSLNSMAEMSGREMVNIAVRTQQKIITRRRFGNVRGRNGSSWGWRW